MDKVNLIDKLYCGLTHIQQEHLGHALWQIGEGPRREGRTQVLATALFIKAIDNLDQWISLNSYGESLHDPRELQGRLLSLHGDLDTDEIDIEVSLLNNRFKVYKPEPKEDTTTYYEEQIINGVLMFRLNSTRDWQQVSIEVMSKRVIELEERNKEMEYNLKSLRNSVIGSYKDGV